MWKYRWRYAAGALCIAGSVLLKLLIPRILGGSIDALRQAAEGRAEAGAAETEILKTLVAGAVRITVLAAAVAAIRTASRLMVLGTSRRVVHDLRRRLFGHLLRMAPSYFVRNSTGSLMSRCVNDARNVQGMSGPVFMYLAEVATLYAVSLFFLLGIDAFLTGMALLPFPFFLLLARRQAARIQHGSRAAQEGLARISAKVDESLSGQLTIKSLAIEDFDRARFAAECSAYRRMNLEVSWARAGLMPLMLALGSLSTVIVLALGGPRVAAGQMSLGDFLAMNWYLQFLAAPTATLGFVLSSLQRGTAALARIGEVLSTPPSLADPQAPAAAPRFRGAISVRGLTVALPQPSAPPGAQARPVLDGISFEVPAGSTLGVVGRVGAGKSLLAAVLARLLEVDAGTIFLDGVDLTRMRLADVRSQVGLVPQEAFLFSQTLAANIALGRPEAAREEILEAARAARLAQDLDQLPGGLDTLLGERGVNLSGGQRQRAALARVLLLDPRVLILDDTLSAVDAETGDEILAGLRPWMQRRTAVIIAHRLATVAQADRILVLEAGRIAESGTHATLLRQEGIYAATWRRQQTRARLAAGLEEDK